MNVIPILAGATLIVLGVVPGLFQRLTDNVRDACDAVVYGVPRSAHLDDRYRQPVGLACFGVFLIVVAVLALLSI